MSALACPQCGNVNPWSAETTTTMYTCVLSRNESGQVDVEYDGAGYETCDEGSSYEGEIWCRSCGTQLTEDDLAEVSQ